MKRTLSFTTILLSLSLTAQNYSYRYTQVNQLAIQQNNYTYVASNNAGLFSIANALMAFRNSWDNHKKRESEVQKAIAQLSIVKSNYENAESYPETIIDGWHLVMATDNYNYCSPAKVLIENNEIKKLVVDNYIHYSLNFNVLSPIKKGKALLSLDANGNTDTVEVYFINDLAAPTLVDEPLESGYVTFWSDLRKADHIKIWLEKDYYGEIPERLKEEPSCFDESTISIALKPATYFFKAAGRGSIAWEGKIVVKEGECLIINLNKVNKK